MLIVGNPTNVYLAGSAGISFAEYLSVMFVPAVAGGSVGLIALMLLFRKQLVEPIIFTGEEGGEQVEVKKTPMIIALVHLIVCIVALAFSEQLGVEMWLICLVAAASLTIIDTVYDLIFYKSIKPVISSIKKEPFELIPFVLSMFIIVLSLKEQGVTQKLASLLLSFSPTDGATFGFLSVAVANLLNNIPMSVLFESIIGGTSLSAVYGAVIGSNVGAFLTPVGALAGIMWNKILENYGVKLPFTKFAFYGVVVAIPTLIAAILGLLLVL